MLNAAAVSADLMANETRSALPLLLSRDTYAPLYSQLSRRNPTYSTLLVDMVPILKSPHTSEDTLMDILGVMRGSSLSFSIVAIACAMFVNL